MVQTCKNFSVHTAGNAFLEPLISRNRMIRGGGENVEWQSNEPPRGVQGHLPWVNFGFLEVGNAISRLLERDFELIRLAKT